MALPILLFAVFQAQAFGDVRATSDSTFEKDVLKSDLPVMVEFYADWCGPCRQQGPILESVSQSFTGKIHFFKVNMDFNPQIKQRWGGPGIPRILLFDNKGKLVKTLDGLHYEKDLMDDAKNLLGQRVALMGTLGTSVPAPVVVPPQQSGNSQLVSFTASNDKVAPTSQASITIEWGGDCWKQQKNFPARVRDDLDFALDLLQQGKNPAFSHPVGPSDSGLHEITASDQNGWYGVIYSPAIENTIHILNCFAKSTKETAPRELDRAIARLSDIKTGKTQ